MSSSFDALLNKMKKVPIRGGGGGNYINGPGTFEVELISTNRKMALNKEKLVSGKQVRDQEFLIVEFKIVTSNNPDYPEGSSRSWMCKDPTEDDSLGAGDAKAFAVSAMGINPSQIKDNDENAQTQASLLVLAALGEAEAFAALKQPEDLFVGRRLGLETFMLKTKKGSDFTKHRWFPAAD